MQLIIRSRERRWWQEGLGRQGCFGGEGVTPRVARTDDAGVGGAAGELPILFSGPSLLRFLVYLLPFNYVKFYMHFAEESQIISERRNIQFIPS